MNNNKKTLKRVMSGKNGMSDYSEPGVFFLVSA